MKRSAKRKCVHCSELFLSDFRNRGRQRHCAKPACRKVARRSSQQRWLAKAENQNYFRGPENCARVREWRARHPGYWRKKKPALHEGLQESCCAQVPPNKGDCDSGTVRCVTRTLRHTTRGACGTYLHDQRVCVTRRHRPHRPKFHSSWPGHPGHEPRSRIRLEL